MTLPFWLGLVAGCGAEVAGQASGLEGSAGARLGVIAQVGDGHLGHAGRHVDRHGRADRHLRARGRVRAGHLAELDARRWLVHLVPNDQPSWPRLWPAALGCLSDQGRDATFCFPRRHHQLDLRALGPLGAGRRIGADHVPGGTVLCGRCRRVTTKPSCCRFGCRGRLGLAHHVRYRHLDRPAAHHQHQRLVAVHAAPRGRSGGDDRAGGGASWSGPDWRCG